MTKNQMENNKLKYSIKEIRKITMTEEEKKVILQNILNTPIKKIEGPIRSPWFSYFSIYNIRKYNKIISYVILPAIIISTGGTVALASERSLPADLLYPVKVRIVEPITGAFKLNQEAKAKHESSLASKRLIEAEILISQNKLDTVKEKELNTLLSSHTDSFNKAIAKIDQNNSEENVDEIITNFKAEMNAHAEILDFISKDDDKKIEETKNIEDDDKKIEKEDQIDQIEKIDNIEINSDKEVDNTGDKKEEQVNLSDESEKIKEENILQTEKIEDHTNLDNSSSQDNLEDISLPIKNDEEINKNIKISETARFSANSIKENIIGNEKEYNDKYQQRKEVIISLINKAKQDLEGVKINQPGIDKGIIENTYKTIEKANLYLNEADKRQLEGNSKDSYTALLNSESSIREASIFLKTGLGLKNNLNSLSN